MSLFAIPLYWSGVSLRFRNAYRRYARKCQDFLVAVMLVELYNINVKCNGLSSHITLSFKGGQGAGFVKKRIVKY